MNIYKASSRQFNFSTFQHGHIFSKVNNYLLHVLSIIAGKKCKRHPVKKKRKERNRRATMFKVTFSFTPQSFLGGFKYYCFCYDCLHKETLPVSKGSGNIIEKHFIVKDLSL